MKKSLILSLFIFLAGSLMAQEVIYTPYEKFDIRNGDFSVVGKVGDKMYTYRGGDAGYFLDAWNDSMEKMATVVLDFFPRKIYETKFINYPDQIIVLYQASEGNKITQYAALLDDAGRLKKGPIQLKSDKTGLFGPNREYFSSVTSDDKKSIIVYGIEEKDEELKFSGVWLDDALNITYRSSASFKADNDLSHGDGIIGNDGSFYLPVYTLVGAREYADQLWLLSLTKGDIRFTSKEFPLGGLYAAGSYMKLDNNSNRIYLGGFYSDKKNGNYEGVLYAYYDLNEASFKNVSRLPFTPQLRNETGERSMKRAFNDFNVKQMIIKKDGGFVLIAENFITSTRTSGPGWGGYYSFYYGPFMSPSIREYIYGDIFAASYDDAGNLQWHSFIRKNQYSQEDGGIFSSYALLNTGGSLGFLFNDFDQNRSRIQLATLDAQGEQKMLSLSAGGKNDPDWLPRSGKQVAARTVIVPCLSRRQICFAKIMF